MSPLRLSALLPLVLALLAGCGSPPPSNVSPTGSMRLAIATPSAVQGDISRVTVTVSSSDMASLSTDLVLTDGTWGGVIGDIPAGEHRTFLAQAFTASNTLRYEGRAEDVTVTAGATGLVTLTLQDVSIPPPFTNEAPVVDSLVANPTTVAPGGTVSLSVSAHDPNPGDTVSYAWTAASGSFSAPTQASTTWTAPSFQAPVNLSLTVSDSRGAALTVSLTVTVSAGSGAAEVKVGFNSAPRVVALTSSQSWLDVGQQTTLSVSATDTDGDSLSYQWSATCAGGFTNASTASTTFTPSDLPTAACNNCQLNVTVKDGRGGQNTGSLALCVSKSPIWGTPASWHATGSMATSRYSHTATLLPGGKVLVAGGNGNGGITASSELYDPASGKWSPTTSMLSGRYLHSATLLPGGKVLVVGGRGNSGYTASSELYDPASGTWSPTGALAAPRAWHQATLLPDGKVLVSGGHTGNYLATAEVYDPASGTWSATGSMTSARHEHRATLLPDGKVLVTGGVNSGGYLSTVEEYDPATDQWSPLPAMTAARYEHTATLLFNGKVLVAGGANGTSGYLATAEVYDPATGTWSATGSLVSKRYLHQEARLRDGKVLILGGLNSGGYMETSEVYDPATGTWSSAGSMTTTRAWHQATLLANGKVLVSGGDSNTGYLATAEFYGTSP
ncbi:Kelch repeat-containing protein [Cystobacter ferrugineus]|uniref:Branched-chain amino acid ABC transporter substrate-binding protein n=1 Tax=Cystobacter ferrugineus TaxID=83449 RepID=A0A1L9BFR0_9BACT|nr:kelch repeat-containing protein [Cystobacter ferrugineus]OJH41099.1 hypothetical protein BON30_09365 [Cystobacter ferrugineus]